MKKYKLKKDLMLPNDGITPMQISAEVVKTSAEWCADTFISKEWLESENSFDWFEEVVEEVNPILWKPGEEEDYYMVHSPYRHNSYNQEIIDNRYRKHILYPTEELVQKAFDRQLAYMELIRAIARANGDWVADWGKDSQQKWYFDYIADEGVGMIYINYFRFLPPELYIKSEEVGKRILEDLSEDKIKLAMGWE